MNTTLEFYFEHLYFYAPSNNCDFDTNASVFFNTFRPSAERNELVSISDLQIGCVTCDLWTNLIWKGYYHEESFSKQTSAFFCSN